MDYFSDEELVRLYVATLHNTHFEQLYTRYKNRVYYQCLSFTKNPVEAQDLMHDIFLKLVDKVSSFRAQAKFSTWLNSFTFNYCADQIRIRRIRQNLFIYTDWATLEAAVEDGVTEETEWEASSLEWSLHQLPLSERTLLIMKYQDGLSLRQIAGLNSTTEGAVKMRLLRSRQKLRLTFLNITQ